MLVIHRNGNRGLVVCVADNDGLGAVGRIERIDAVHRLKLRAVDGDALHRDIVRSGEGDAAAVGLAVRKPADHGRHRVCHHQGYAVKTPEPRRSEGVVHSSFKLKIICAAIGFASVSNNPDRFARGRIGNAEIIDTRRDFNGLRAAVMYDCLRVACPAGIHWNLVGKGGIDLLGGVATADKRTIGSNMGAVGGCGGIQQHLVTTAVLPVALVDECNGGGSFGCRYGDRQQYH